MKTGLVVEKAIRNEIFDIVHKMSQLTPLPYIPSLKVITIPDFIIFKYICMGFI